MDKELFVAAEGMYTGQFVFSGKKAQVTIGNILPLKSLPEGTVVCNLEARPGDRGKLARASGDYASIISHNELGETYVRLPSGSKLTLDSK